MYIVYALYCFLCLDVLHNSDSYRQLYIFHSSILTMRSISANKLALHNNKNDPWISIRRKGVVPFLLHFGQNTNYGASLQRSEVSGLIP